jgi:DNA-binding beta-propeller fold protein YncE
LKIRLICFLTRIHLGGAESSMDAPLDNKTMEGAVKANIGRIIIASAALAAAVALSAAEAEPQSAATTQYYMRHALEFDTLWLAQGISLTTGLDLYGIDVSPKGYFYVCDIENDRVQKFSPTGNFVRFIGSSGQGNGQFLEERGICFSPDGSYYVADTENNRIQHFNGKNDAFMKAWGTQGSSQGQLNAPRSLTVGRDGSVWVVDSENCRVVHYDANGTRLGGFGSEGTGQQQFHDPRGIALDRAGNIYVSDSVNDRVMKFDSTGKFLKQWGGVRGQGDGQFYFPYGIQVCPDGSFFVVDHQNHRFQKFDSTGKFVGKWGSEIILGPTEYEGLFAYPVDLAVTPDGNVYVTDYTGRVQKFAPKTYTPRGGKFFTLSGKIAGLKRTELKGVTVALYGKIKSDEFFAVTKPNTKTGEYSFDGFPKRGDYLIVVLGYNSVVVNPTPDTLSGKVKKDVKGLDFQFSK